MSILNGPVMSASEPSTWKAVLLLMASSISVSVTVTIFILSLHSSSPHEGAALLEDVIELKQLSGQLGKLSSNSAKSIAVMESLRRDLERNIRAIERLEERLP